ncbi:unnamed protein product [Ceratitis capitata]|uniref:(Mediterranean fruit fly) hypothetical protein n=1 Tax=Ceratitis capitata TaxID=7213 RepID=A0A811V2K7_CERCA|nr:unnamed protein product [Ceratitis capitata]
MAVNTSITIPHARLTPGATTWTHNIQSNVVHKAFPGCLLGASSTSDLRIAKNKYFLLLSQEFAYISVNKAPAEAPVCASNSDEYVPVYAGVVTVIRFRFREFATVVAWYSGFGIKSRVQASNGSQFASDFKHQLNFR